MPVCYISILNTHNSFGNAWQLVRNPRLAPMPLGKGVRG